MMKQQLIAFETARLAKKKGFGIAVNSYYNTAEPDRIVTCGAANWNYKAWGNVGVSAPPQSILQKWIRENSNLHVEIYCNASEWGQIITKINGSIIKEIQDDIFFETYEQALEEGLNQALNLI